MGRAIAKDADRSGEQNSDGQGVTGSTNDVYEEADDGVARFVAYSSPYLFWIVMGLIGTAFWFAA